MDLQLYMRVIWRFRFLVAAGLLLALTLSLLSMMRVSFDGARPELTYRQNEVWGSTATLLVTQRGFPLGRSITELYDFRVDPRTGRQVAEPRFADSERFADLATLYARLATSDPVLALMLRDGPLDGIVEADSVDTSSRDTLPLVEILALADTPVKAIRLAQRNTAAFLTYLEQEQDANRIPARERIVVSVVQRPLAVTLVEGRKITRPVMIFMAVMIAILGLAFVLENLRPRVRVLSGDAGDGVVAGHAARHTA